MKIIEHERKYSESFLEVAQGQVFRYEGGIFMRTMTVTDATNDFLAKANAVSLIEGDMIWLDNDDSVEILEDARLILT